MYIYACVYVFVHLFSHTCVCVCVCIFVPRLWVLVSVLQRVDSVMHVNVFSCAYVCVYVCVWVYIYVRTRVGAFCLFVLSNFSSTCACITGVSQHLHACVGENWKWGLCLFMVSACYWRGRLCFGGGRDIGFVLYISQFLQVLGWCVCVCLYTRVHTNKLLGYLM